MATISAEIDATALQSAMTKYGNASAASRALGIPRTSFIRKLQAISPVVADIVAPAPEITEVERLTAELAAVKAKLAKKGKSDVEKPVSGGSVLSPKPSKFERRWKRFLISSAQNNTDVLPGFIASLHTYVKENADTKILIARNSYNSNAWSQNVTKDDDGLWYAAEILPYVCDESVELAPGLVFCGELDILPTAVDPLSGFDSYTKSASAIVPHPKVAMKSMATMKNERPRFLYTTGSVTQINYIARKAGQKAAFHHVYGALLVEVDEDGAWFVRQIVADETGSFYDLDRFYTPTGSTTARVEAVTWGDFHQEKADPIVEAACFDGPRSVIETLRPREQHVHDLADFTARNHHNRNDPYFNARQLVAGLDSVERDITVCAQKLERIQRDWCTTVVVESNHDQAFRRWLGEANGHNDAPNARYWHYWNYKIFVEIEARRDLFVFAEAVREKLSKPLPGLRFLREDDSWVICSEHGGIECGLHGHRGPNGSRGSPRAYRQLGTRCNTAHTHSAGIVDGVYTAGVSGALDMGYNAGPGSWSHSHIVTYPNGKRAIITMRGSRWRATWGATV